jgi:hypothetical protein
MIRLFFCHVLHSALRAKMDYVRENPVRAGLVSTAEKWKYQGEIVEIDHA